MPQLDELMNFMLDVMHKLKKGATKRDTINNVSQAYKGEIRKCFNRLEKDGEIVKFRGRYFTKETVPSSENSPVIQVYNTIESSKPIFIGDLFQNLSRKFSEGKIMNAVTFLLQNGAVHYCKGLSLNITGNCTVDSEGNWDYECPLCDYTASGNKKEKYLGKEKDEELTAQKDKAISNNPENNGTNIGEMSDVVCDDFQHYENSSFIQPLKTNPVSTVETVSPVRGQGIKQHSTSIKEVEDDIQGILKKVNELTGIKKSATGLAPPALWDLAADKQTLQNEQPLQVARCTKIITTDSDEPKYIIDVKQFAKFFVDLADSVAPTDIEEGMRVGVDNNTYEIRILLPTKLDQTVTMMQVEEKPDVTDSNVGMEQIEKLREAIKTPHFHGQTMPEKQHAQAIFPWKSEYENHLTFNEGDIINITKQDSRWWFGELHDKNGWFPSSFVKLLPRPMKVNEFQENDVEESAVVDASLQDEIEEEKTDSNCLTVFFKCCK